MNNSTSKNNITFKLTKNVFVLFLLILSLFIDCSCKNNDEFSDFFSNNYETIMYETSIGNVYYSYNYVNKDRKIVDKAIIYQKNDNEIIPLLIINQKKVSNSNEVIIDTSSNRQEYYGWIIHFNSQALSCSLDYYTDNGKHVADSIYLKWDNSINCFNKNRIDFSNY